MINWYLISMYYHTSSTQPSWECKYHSNNYITSYAFKSLLHNAEQTAPLGKQHITQNNILKIPKSSFHSGL